LVMKSRQYFFKLHAKKPMDVIFSKKVKNIRQAIWLMLCSHFAIVQTLLFLMNLV